MRDELDTSLQSFSGCANTGDISSNIPRIGTSHACWGIGKKLGLPLQLFSSSNHILLIYVLHICWVNGNMGLQLFSADVGGGVTSSHLLCILNGRSAMIITF